MKLDISKMNNSEHYGNMKLELINTVNEYQSNKSEKNSKLEGYGPKTREDIIVKILAELYGVKIDFIASRKFCKRFLQKLVCVDVIDANSFCELLYISKASPDHFELSSLKDRVTNEEYDQLTVKTRTKSSRTYEGVVAIALSKNFYSSHEWKAARYQALRIYKNYCHCCGRKRSDTISLQVDHIKPRSLVPELALDVSNMQILCMDCNMGKSNLDCTDWRD